MHHAARAELLAVIRMLDAAAHRPGEPDPDYRPRVDRTIAFLVASLNPPPPLPPSRLGLVLLARDEWAAFEGDRIVPFRSSLKGLHIVHAVFQCANGSAVGPLPPDAFSDGLRPRQSVDKAIKLAARSIEKHGLQWLAREMRKVKVRSTAGQELLIYIGDRNVDTTRV